MARPADPTHGARLLWDNSFHALAVVDDHRHYLSVNPATAALFGRRTDDIIGDRIDTFTPDDRLDALCGLWDDLARAGELQGPYEMRREDGRRTLIEFRAIRDFGRDQHLIIARELIPDVVRSGRRLTPRERQVLQLAADGGATREIAELLFVSPGTVKTHFENIYEKLAVRDRAAAVAEGIRRGLIT